MADGAYGDMQNVSGHVSALRHKVEVLHWVLVLSCEHHVVIYFYSKTNQMH